eukprot:scaffold1514_cov113-Skeletonema_dohrnii-CCMP3373.AAC.8
MDSTKIERGERIATAEMTVIEWYGIDTSLVERSCGAANAATIFARLIERGAIVGDGSLV